MIGIVIFDIDGVVRDVSGSYRRAIADTVEHYTDSRYRPSLADIDQLKSEGIWNNDWEASQELVYRYWEALGRSRHQVALNYENLVNFFQSRYRGEPEQFNGYITTEPLLLSASYLEKLLRSGINWGFFSGATRGSAEYVLKARLGLHDPVLVAMEDAPGKPDPTGLLAAVRRLEAKNRVAILNPVIYVGDTVADMYTVAKAREVDPKRLWISVGVLPPHVQSSPRMQFYAANLQQAGAAIILDNVQQLTPERVQQLLTVRQADS